VTESRPDRAKRVYGSQFDVPPDDIPGALTEMFGPRMTEEALYAMGGTAWDDALSWKERSLAVIAVLIAQGGVEDRLRTHIRWAVRNGATREELDALVSMLTVYVGYPRAVAGMEVLLEELGPVQPEP
jgi:alkylhydroperoxidase/carboxymuconolactone decarboxylase family protein YurZ